VDDHPVSPTCGITKLAPSSFAQQGLFTDGERAIKRSRLLAEAEDISVCGEKSNRRAFDPLKLYRDNPGI
jgi:hypothetical protein